MLQIVTEPQTRAVGLTATGAPTPDERAQVVSLLDEQIGPEGDLHLLLELTDGQAEASEALLAKLFDGLSRPEAVRRVAVVGDEQWERAEEGLRTLLPQSEVQFFRPVHLAEAWQWVRGKVG